MLEAGFVTALLLVGVTASIFALVPLPWKAKRGVLKSRRRTSPSTRATMTVGQRIRDAGLTAFSQWNVFIFHVLLIASMYMFMGVSLTAHISVLLFEMLWHLVIAPLYVWYMDNYGDHESIAYSIPKLSVA
jgi:hypothetical protein